jgi:hypothetical protein
VWNRRDFCELALLIVVSALVLTAAALAGRFDLVSGKRSELLYDKTYTSDQPAAGGDERLDGAWSATTKGLSLEPGQSGTLTIRFTPIRDGRLVLLLFGRDRPGFHRTLAVSGDGRHFREVLLQPDLNGARIDVTGVAGHLEEVWLKVEAAVNPDAPPSGSPALLSRVRVVQLNGPTSIPNWPLASLLILTPAMAYVSRKVLGRSGGLLSGFVILGGLTVLVEGLTWTRVTDNPDRWWELVVLSQERDRYFLIPYGLLLAMFAWQVKVWQTGNPSERFWIWFALAGVLVWGASARLAALTEMGWTQLDQDAVTYMQITDMMSAPYDTNSREPLWIWIVKGWFLLIGVSPLHLRILTVLLSLILILVAYKLFTDYTDRPLVGLVVALLLSSSPYLIRLSVRGLREEAYMIAVLCLVYLVFVPGIRRPGWQATGLALAGAAVQLLRFNSYTLIAPLLLWWGWKRASGRWWLAGLALLFIVGVSIPHLLHNARLYGDPMYSVNVHFVWARNYEFVLLKEIGCDGCPSRDQALMDSTLGPTINAFQYLFGLHGINEIMELTVRGYLDLYLRPGDLFEIQSGLRSFTGYLVYLIGLGLVLCSEYRAMLVVLLLLANMVPFAVSLGIDPRIAISTAPFVMFVAAYGLVRCLEAVTNLRALGRLSPAPSWLPRFAKQGDLS